MFWGDDWLLFCWFLLAVFAGFCWVLIGFGMFVLLFVSVFALVFCSLKGTKGWLSKGEVVLSKLLRRR